MKFFWTSYIKFMVATIVGFGLSSFLYTPIDLAITMIGGAIVSFPAAFVLIKT